MLSPARALTLNAEAGRPLPRVEELADLYRNGCNPRHGEVIMVAGRSGTQKSGFALWWTIKMGLPTLYLSADMSAFTASVRVAGMLSGYTSGVVENLMKVAGEERESILRALEDEAGHIQFEFGKLTWRGLDAALDAYIELHNAYPEVIVVDNLMDIEGCATDYQPQMEAMDSLTALARKTGATVIVLHHASDKSWEAKSDPWNPPSRDQIKNGLAEKPELCLAVALNPQSFEYRIAVLKQRMGPQDPTAQTFTSLRADPEHTRFHKWNREDRLQPLRKDH